MIFFNNVGYLGMCGHGTMGLIVSLAHLGKIKPGSVRLDTPVGAVEATLHANGEVSFVNVPSYRKHQALELYLPGVGDVLCDIAWGGNWFCLIEKHDQTLELNNIAQLTEYSSRMRQAVSDSGFPEVDHVELFGPSAKPGVNSKSFVLCPGKAYDRSPCGTGTSAKLACLAADGKLKPGESWRQESVIGSVFSGHYARPAAPLPKVPENAVLPFIHGRAFVTLDANMIFDSADAFAWGLA